MNTRCQNKDQTFDAEDQISSCTAILAQRPLAPGDRVFALYYRSDALRRSSDFEGSLRDLNELLPLARSSNEKAIFLADRAVMNHRLQRPRQARADIDDAIAANPDQSFSFKVRAQFRETDGQYALALADYDRANQLRPEASTRNGACWIRAAYLDREIDRARSDCAAAIALEPNEAAYRDSLGMVELRAGRAQAAWEAYNSAVGLKDDNASALYGRGLANLALGRTAAGNADLAKARQLDPKVEASYAAKGLKP